jgi:hypothetical protein
MIHIERTIQKAIAQIDKELENIDIEFLRQQVDQFYKLESLKDDLIELLHDLE